MNDLIDLIESLLPDGAWAGSPKNTTLQLVLKAMASATAPASFADVADGASAVETQVVLVDAVGGNATLTLPHEDGMAGAFVTLIVKDNDNNTITIDTAGDALIDGAATDTTSLTTAGTSVRLFCDGVNYYTA